MTDPEKRLLCRLSAAVDALHYCQADDPAPWWHWHTYHLAGGLPVAFIEADRREDRLALNNMAEGGTVTLTGSTRDRRVRLTPRGHFAALALLEGPTPAECLEMLSTVAEAEASRDARPWPGRQTGQKLIPGWKLEKSARPWWNGARTAADFGAQEHAATHCLALHLPLLAEGWLSVMPSAGRLWYHVTDAGRTALAAGAAALPDVSNIEADATMEATDRDTYTAALVLARRTPKPKSLASVIHCPLPGCDWWST
jgi:hypothetical protein